MKRRVILALALTLSGCGRFAPADTREAEACTARRDQACAERGYRAFLLTHPNDARRIAMLALTLTREGRHAEALPYYDRAEAAGIRITDIYSGHALSLDAEGRLEAAMRYNRMALVLMPQLVDVRSRLADQLVRQGRRAEAIALLRSFDEDGVRWRRAPYFTDEIARLEGKP